FFAGRTEFKTAAADKRFGLVGAVVIGIFPSISIPIPIPIPISMEKGGLAGNRGGTEDSVDNNDLIG
ncbi:MAG: hypothetical protein ACLFUY_10545, partial [Desulfobacterales bacterium]